MPKIIRRTLSIRLSLMVVVSMALLLMVSMTIMLYYSRKAVKEETVQKATQALDGAVQHIDNILLSVELSAGNIYFSMLPHLDDPDMLLTYSRKMLEANPYVNGCAIAMKPYFFKDREYFMAYVHRTDEDGIADSDSPIIQSETFGDRPYTEQAWFTEPMASHKATWLNPLKGMKTDIDPLMTFCLPIYGADGMPAGVMGIDISLSLLSNVVLATKPSPNSYCILLDSAGSFIVYPDSAQFFQHTILTQDNQSSDPSVRKAVQAMISGESGYKPFHFYDSDFYVFYKPFKRSVVPGRAMEELNWSAGIIYPEDDVVSDYRSLLYYVLAITFASLLLMFLLCKTVIHRQLKPLLRLTRQAQHIAEGNYDEPLPDSRHDDEVGRLQNNVRKMQQSLAAHIGELEDLKTTLQQRGQELKVAYNEAQKADRIKTAFLHNMTNQMIAPTNAISKDVEILCGTCGKGGRQDITLLADDIQQNGHTITELLKNLINMSDDEIRKEEAYE